MKITSWNVNGLRACGRNGFLKWLKREQADIVCLQEIKARPEQLDEELRHPLGYESFWHPAEKPGYSGVAIYSKVPPIEICTGIGEKEIDREGRALVLKFKSFTLINAYFPNSQRDHARLPYKLSFCRKILKYMENLREAGENVVICGDFNIAHQDIDLKNPKSNRDNAGFLPEERRAMDQFLKAGYVDVFRKFVATGGHYTWWSYRPGVREKNVGWRIDLFLVSGEFAKRVTSAFHRPEVMGSDHCPIGIVVR